MRCPNCGVELDLTVKQDPPWQTQRWIEYGAGPGGGTIDAGTTWTRREPARPPVSADVIVPAAWSGLTGVALSLLSLPFTILGKIPWWTPLVALTGGSGLTWLVLMVRWEKLLWRIEEITGGDLDGDGQTGEPGPRRTVRVELSEPEKRAMRFLDLPVSDETLRSVAIAVLRNGRPFSRRALAGIISESDFNRLHAGMLDAGLARYKGGKPNAGTELTPAGRAVLKHFLEVVW